MSDFYSLFISVICRLFFGRVRLVGRLLSEGECPALYVGVTRNGLLDEWIFSYLYFGVTRKPMRFWSFRHDRNLNPDDIVDSLMLGSPFFIFVSSADLESDSPLSLINQAAQIAKSAGHKRADIEIVPVELFYDSWGANAAWGSDVDVFIGESICLSALTSDPRFMELGFTKQKFKELNTAKLSARIKDALLEMAGNNRFSRLSLSMARQLAHLAATDGRASYALCLSVIAQLPEHSPLVKSWDVFRGYCEDLGVWKVNGFPIFTTQELLPLVIETILSAIPAAADIFLNVPAFVFVFASLLIMKDKDADNRRRKRSVAFAASIVPWTVLLWYQFCLYGLPWLILPHLLITALGGYYTRLFRVGLAQIINSARHPELRGIYGRLRDELLGMIYRD